MSLATPSYCYWSVATGGYGALMENCVRSARAAGVFKEFHVLTDRPLEGCECYDAYECDKAQGLFKLHYLKVGMSRLNLDCFIWLDADTVFARNPVDILGALRRSPIHVPLEVDLAGLAEDREHNGISCFKLRELYAETGVLNQPYACSSAFWIVRREAIDAVYDLAFQFVNSAREKGVTVNVDAALGYAMQMLCGDPEAHLVTRRPELWGVDEAGCQGVDGEGEFQDRRCGPAIMHLQPRREEDRSGPTTVQRAATPADVRPNANAESRCPI